MGQLLIAMLAAQRANNDGLPIYGAWVAGADWRFVWLEANAYSKSFSYDATNPKALTEIWFILNKTKQMIYKRVEKFEAEKKYR